MAYEHSDGTVQLEFDWSHEDEAWAVCAPGNLFLYYEIAPYAACLGRPVEPPSPPPWWTDANCECWYVWVMNLAAGKGEYLPTPYASAHEVMHTIEKGWERSSLSPGEQIELARLKRARLAAKLSPAAATSLSR
jgi:hypothetical protein